MNSREFMWTEKTDLSWRKEGETRREEQRGGRNDGEEGMTKRLKKELNKKIDKEN